VKDGRLVCITVGIVARKDDVCGTAMKGNDNDWWSSNCVVLLGKRQNGDVVERWGEWAMLK
jgi:hypothetical protein